MLRTSVCVFVFSFAVELIWAEETVKVKTEDTGAALVNPQMGWTMHFYSNVPRNYGSKLDPADTLDDFPGLSTVYLRIPWAYLEPESTDGMFTESTDGVFTESTDGHVVFGPFHQKKCTPKRPACQCRCFPQT